MQKNNRRKTDRELDDTRVKMYKTHHGWVSCLTRFFHLLSFGNKEEVQAEQFIDEDSIKEQRAMSTDAYLKGLGLLSTLLGVGGVSAVAPTAVHAANLSADPHSQVVGSTAAANSASNVQQDSTSTSLNSNSTSKSNSSNSTSTTTQTSDSNSSSTSGSTSDSGALKSTSGSTSGTNNSQAAAISTASGNLSSQSVMPTAQAGNVTPSVASAQLTGLAAVSFAAVNNTATVKNASEFMTAIGNSNISVINLVGDVDLSGQGIMNITRDLTINANGHKIWLTGANSQFKLNAQGIKFAVNDADIYFSGRGLGTNTNGAIYLSYGNDQLNLNNVNITGGTAIHSYTNLSASVANNVVTLSGNDTFTATSAVQTADGSTVATGFEDVDKQGASQLYIGDNLLISGGAKVTILGNNIVNYNLAMKGNSTTNGHTVTIEQGANVTMNGAAVGNVLMDQSLYGSEPSNTFTVANGATLNMEAANFNIAMTSGDNARNQTIDFQESSTVHMKVTQVNGAKTGDANILVFGQQRGYQPTGAYNDGTHGVQDHIATNPTATINVDKGAWVTMEASGSAANIRTYIKNTNVNITNPYEFSMAHAQNTDALVFGGNSKSGQDTDTTVTVKDANERIDDGTTTQVFKRIIDQYIGKSGKYYNPYYSTSELLKPVLSTSASLSTVSDSLNSTSRSVVVTSQSVSTASQSVISVSQGVSTASQAVDSASRSVSTASDSVTIVSENVSTASQKVTIASQSVSTASQSLIVASQNVSTESQRLHSASESVTNDSNSVVVASQSVATKSNQLVSTSASLSNYYKDSLSDSVVYASIDYSDRVRDSYSLQSVYGSISVSLRTSISMSASRKGSTINTSTLNSLAMNYPIEQDGRWQYESSGYIYLSVETSQELQ